MDAGENKKKSFLASDNSNEETIKSILDVQGILEKREPKTQSKVTSYFEQ